ncbi:Hsp20/alpha crystallin family protein [Massilia horti]|uniref:Hsp20/alpha crystallin family protein n=1 Tax=Massilia horti TaxID=2562153 RepID=A0A4Y9T7V7_9BURK|nr:Hsp20/alpha crystallin family protein [Massilia horti]TFW34832.1 Hsp20/alpha crystallin family protein [Massilia horti]
MKVRDPTIWMWGEALDMLERADRLHRQFFQLSGAGRASPTWEPPLDIFETASQLIVMVALPGVTADAVAVDVELGAIVVRGQRRLPAFCANCDIRRLELPYGNFERRIELPGQQLQLGARRLEDGCLTLELNKLGVP